jgi:hypothetical protein
MVLCHPARRYLWTLVHSYALKGAFAFRRHPSGSHLFPGPQRRLCLQRQVCNFSHKTSPKTTSMPRASPMTIYKRIIGVSICRTLLEGLEPFFFLFTQRIRFFTVFALADGLGKLIVSPHMLKTGKEEAGCFRIASEGLNQFGGNALWEIRPHALLLQDRISRLDGLDRSLRYV